MCTQKMRALSYIGTEKITFSPKPDRQTDKHTYRRTDISVYRVASLLKIIVLVYFVVAVILIPGSSRGKLITKDQWKNCLGGRYGTMKLIICHMH